MGYHNITTALDLVSTTQQAPLGKIFQRPDPVANAGLEEWVYVKNGEASTAFAAGTVLGHKDGTATYEVVRAPANCNPSRVVAVAQAAIAAGSYGWVQRKGQGLVKADTGDIAVDTGLIVGDTAGTADGSAAQTDNSFGHSTNAIAAGATGLVFLDCRG